MNPEEMAKEILDTYTLQDLKEAKGNILYVVFNGLNKRGIECSIHQVIEWTDKVLKQELEDIV